MPRTDNAKRHNSGTDLGFEVTRWATADKLRGNLAAAEYNGGRALVLGLGLIFFKYMSDAFEEKHAALQKEKGADPEDRGEYLAENVFWVPPEARWSYLLGRAKDPVISKLLDNAMVAIERDNPSLKNTLPKDYTRPHLDRQSLGGVIDLTGSIDFKPSRVASRHPLPSDGRGAGCEGHHAKDVLGRVYEYFLSQFASAQTKCEVRVSHVERGVSSRKLGIRNSSFDVPNAPRCVVGLLVEILAPWKGCVFDPCCGSGGMLVQSVEFVEARATGNGNGGKAKGDLWWPSARTFGQESYPSTWRLAKMNLAIRGVEGDLGDEPADSFYRDLHKDPVSVPKSEIRNPKLIGWGGDRLREEVRWKLGVPPAGNANYAWVQHFLHHFAPKRAWLNTC